MMVGFGKALVQSKRAPWSGAYIDYDGLKQILVDIEAALSSGRCAHQAHVDASLQSLETTEIDVIERLKIDFFANLKTDIERMSLFVLLQQGVVADAIGSLKFASSKAFGENNALIRGLKNNVEAFTAVGVELLELQLFTLINAIGVRKILKKYNKIFERLDEPHCYVVPGEHLHQLSYSRSISAIQSSLHGQLTEIFNQQSLSNDDILAENLYRFHFVMSCSFLLKRNAEMLGLPSFYHFISRQSLVTGADLGGMDKKSLTWLMELDPEAILQKNRNELRIMWSGWSGGPKVEQKPYYPDIDLGQLPTIQKDEAASTPDSISMTLNLCSVLLYTVNYYIVAPTANHYAIKVGADGAFGATIIGASSLSALAAAFFYSLWYTRYSFRSALIFSAVCPVVGNILYGLAISYDSLKMAIIGRGLCGFGSGEVLNRQLIAACVDFEGMTRASALFVAAGAIGMSIGPLLAGILDLTAGHDTDVDYRLPFMPAGGIIVDHITAPGFLMAALWFVELFCLVFWFKEPVRINSNGNPPVGGVTAEDVDKSDEETNPLIKKQLHGAKMSTTSVWQEAMATSRLILKNPGLPVTVILFGFVEMVCEILISSCSMVVRRYFDWPGSVAGFVIASLGALVLPADFVVEKAAHYYSERKILFRSLVFILVSLFLIINWSGLFYDLAGTVIMDTYDSDLQDGDISQVEIGKDKVSSLLTKEGEMEYDFGAGPVVYLVFLSLIFMSTIVLESVDASLMAKSSDPELNGKFFNCGLLATLAGTFGRVAADGMITMSAVLDVHIFIDFVNATFIPLLFLAVGGLYMVHKLYHTLV